MLNIATRAAGEIRVELRDESDQAIPGYSLCQCVPVGGDSQEQVVRWKDQADLGELAGRTVRLWLVMRDADVFALRFRA